MRKVLLASSALVAAASFATAANAAAPEMKMFGSIDIQYKGESHDDAGTNNQTPANTDDLGELPFMTSIHFDINAESDSGLSYGGRVDWRPSTNSNDELWIDVASSWGKVVLGRDDSVLDDNVPNGASALVGSFGYTGTYIGGTANSAQVGTAQTNSNPTSNSFDASKVTYYTPDFSGFGAGVSYMTDTDSGTTYDAQTDVAAWWSGDVSSASVKVAAGYRSADNNTSTSEDLAAWELGTLVGIGDFTVAANYFDNGDSGEANNSTGDGGDGYGLGVAYSFGDAAVSLGYLSTEKEVTGSGGTDEYENVSIDVQYTVAEGLLTYAGVQFAESTDASVTGNGHEQDSTTLLLGTRLSW